MVNRLIVVVSALFVLLAGGSWTTAAARQVTEEGSSAAALREPYAVLFVPAGSEVPLQDLQAPALLLQDLEPAAAISLQEAAKAQPSPDQPPAHTGFAALVYSTGSDFAAFPRRKSTWVILGIGGAAALLVHPWDDDINEELQDSSGLKNFFKPGKYLGYGWVQMGAAVGLYVIGRYAVEPDPGTEHTNKYSHLGFDLLRAQIVTQAFTYAIKYAAQRDRPTGECCAFPSGHASVTFATASVLERHLGYRASWPMFAIAGYVSVSRLTDNRHFLSDVLFGSALGMAAGWTVVGRHGRDKWVVLPTPVKGGIAVAGSWTPGVQRRTSSH